MKLAQWLVLQVKLKTAIAMTKVGNRLILIAMEALDPLDGVRTEVVSNEHLYLVVKQYDGNLNFDALIADNDEDAKKQAWLLPGALMFIKSMLALRLELLANITVRRSDKHDRAKRPGSTRARPDLQKG